MSKYSPKDFNLHITHFPLLSSNIPSSPAYSVYLTTHRTARSFFFYECFILRAARLSNKHRRGQGYVKERLKSSLRSFLVNTRILLKQ